MNGFDVYWIMNTCNAHFFTQSFDMTKTPRTRKPKAETFERRKDRWAFEKVAKRCRNEREVMATVVAMISQKRARVWSGDIKTDEANVLKSVWIGKTDRLQYTTIDAYEELLRKADGKGLRVSDLCRFSGGRHPLLYKEYLGGAIEVEPFTVLAYAFRMLTQETGDVVFDSEREFYLSYFKVIVHVSGFDLRTVTHKILQITKDYSPS